MAVDTGLINKSDKELPGAGKAQTQWSPTVRREAPGPETSIEIKAPTTVGTRTSVPFRQVLPSYRRKAESAMNRQQIPKQHQKRVREYFESLQGGGGR